MTDTSAEGMDEVKSISWDMIAAKNDEIAKLKANLAAARAERDEARADKESAEQEASACRDSVAWAEAKLAGVYEECSVIAEKAKCGLVDASTSTIIHAHNGACSYIAYMIRQRAGRMT